MIPNKKTLKFYIMADMMMNRGKFKWTLADRIKNLFFPDYIMSYLKSLRYTAYMKDNPNINFFSKFVCILHLCRVKRLGVKLGFSIGYQVFGYGLIIPHFGTIVVGSSNHIGNYSVLHTSTCISDKGIKCGNGFISFNWSQNYSRMFVG